MPADLEEEIRMSGKIDEMKGRIKEAVGDLTDDQDLKDSGKADKAAGKAKEAAERLIDKARSSIKKP
jgi:uncharacterized protein YjbJ (UPF0337 family)